MPIRIPGPTPSVLAASNLPPAMLQVAPKENSVLDSIEMAPRSNITAARESATRLGLLSPTAAMGRTRRTPTENRTMDIRSLLKPRPVAPGIEEKRGLHQWIPGNDVTYYSHHEDPTVNNADMIRWLQETEYFTSSAVADVIANPGAEHPWRVNNPILSQPIAGSLRDTIRNAKETLYVDIFLMGGTWGMDIASELLLAAERGVKVVLVRDTDNRFSSGFEMDPLWSALEEHSHENPNLTVMRAQIKERPSGLPFGLENITRLFQGVIEAPLSFEAKSDHSKVVIADGLTRKPQMWVGSKNTVDSGGSFFYDDVMQVKGPAAAASLVSYLPDMELAYELAVEEGVNHSMPADGWFHGMLQTLRNRRDGLEPTICDKVGSADVLIAENNADDSIRNVEHTVLSLIESATDSIEMYQFLAYSPEIGKALAHAVKRGVKVRILMDSVDKKVPLNATLGYFMDDSGLSEAEVNEIIRWRTQLPGSTQLDNGVENPIEPQQQHVKTIIVDKNTVFGGSTNFDIASLSGAFREFSIAVKDESVAMEAHADFDEIFLSSEQSAPYETLIQQDPSWFDMFLNKVVKDILLTESWRIGALSVTDRLTKLWS